MAVNEDAIIDTMISLGTLAALVYFGVHVANIRSNDFTEYDFKGGIKNEIVRFEESWLNSKRAFLTVEKPDGRTVEYRAREGPGHQLMLEQIVTKRGVEEARLILPRGISNEAKAEAEAAFKGYLTGILETKLTLSK